MQYRKLVKGAIRLPIIFFGLNTMLKCKKQTNITFFVKLSILNYRCPGVTYITNFTRMPLEKMSAKLLSEVLKLVYVDRVGVG